MDFTQYSFYFQPRQSSFRPILHLVVLLLLVVFFCLSWTSTYVKWRVRPDIPQRQFSLEDFRTGDILLNFKHGLFLLFPGHMGIVVELPRYGQKYVWDLQPYHSPTVLKPLANYITGSLSGRNATVYVYHQTGPLINPALLLGPIKALSSSVQYEACSLELHLQMCTQLLLGLPGIPDCLPTIVKKDLHSCSSAILQLLIHATVLHPSILAHRPDLPFGAALPIYPQNFLSPGWDLNQYVIAPYKYRLFQIIQ